jgi:peptide/nickel transport system permease protein
VPDVTSAKTTRKRPTGFYIASSWLGLMVFFAIFGRFLPLPTWDEAQFDYLGVGPFSAPGHLLGTTNDGYDMLSGLINGAQISIFVSVISVTIGGLIGGAVGITSAYYRGKFDSIVQMIFNIMLSIPNLVLSLALISSFAADTDEQTATVARRMTVLIFSLVIVIVPIVGRIARGSAMQWSNREFVLASKSMGTPNLIIIRKHILPNVAPAMLAIGFLAIGSVIIVEGSLALLGVGIPGGASWGSMLSTGRNYLQFSPHEVYMPALAIAFTVISTNYFGDYVRNQLDKRESKI